MAKDYIVEIEEELELNGETMVKPVGQIVKATPKSGNLPPYCRLQFDDGTSFIWNGDIDEVDENTPEDHPNWIPE